MSDKSLARELQLDAEVTIATINSKIHAKETILKNQQKQMDGEKALASIKHQGEARMSQTAQKPLGSGICKGEKEGAGERTTARGYSDSHKNDNDKLIKDCRFCGGTHAIRRCPAYNKRCNNCKQFNHFAKVCKSKSKVHDIACNEAENSDEFLNLDTLCVHNAKIHGTQWLVNLRMGSCQFEAKVDTGAEVSVMSKNVAKSLGVKQVRKCSPVITGYSGGALPVLGSVELNVSVNFAGSDRICDEVFYVVDQNSQTLLGMPAIKSLGLIPSIEQVSVSTQDCENVLNEYRGVFEGLGKYHTPVKLQLRRKLF